MRRDQVIDANGNELKATLRPEVANGDVVTFVDGVETSRRRVTAEEWAWLNQVDELELLIALGTQARTELAALPAPGSRTAAQATTARVLRRDLALTRVLLGIVGRLSSGLEDAP